MSVWTGVIIFALGAILSALLHAVLAPTWARRIVAEARGWFIRSIQADNADSGNLRLLAAAGLRIERDELVGNGLTLYHRNVLLFAVSPEGVIRRVVNLTEADGVACHLCGVLGGVESLGDETSAAGSLRLCVSCRADVERIALADIPPGVSFSRQSILNTIAFGPGHMIELCVDPKGGWEQVGGAKYRWRGMLNEVQVAHDTELVPNTFLVMGVGSAAREEVRA